MPQKTLPPTKRLKREEVATAQRKNFDVKKDQTTAKNPKHAYGSKAKLLNYDSKEAFCRTDGVNFYIRKGANPHSLFNPYTSIFAEPTDYEKYNKQNKFLKVTKSCFESYKKYLSTRNAKWLNMSENQLEVN